MNVGTVLDFAIATAVEAGRATLAHFGNPVSTDWKDDDSPVTAADRAAERLIRDRIGTSWPNAAVVGEEFGATAQGDGMVWYVDPIDGTKSFIRGVPTYSVLIGCEVDGRIVAGAAYFPALDELIAAADGLGAWHNGRRAAVSRERRLERAFVSHADASSFDALDRGPAWQRVQERSYYCQGCSDAYGYLLVATGRSEIMIDPIVSAWDTAPWPVIFREAGGWFGSWDGREGALGPDALGVSGGLADDVLALLGSPAATG